MKLHKFNKPKFKVSESVHYVVPKIVDSQMMSDKTNHNFYTVNQRFNAVMKMHIISQVYFQRTLCILSPLARGAARFFKGELSRLFKKRPKK